MTLDDGREHPVQGEVSFINQHFAGCSFHMQGDKKWREKEDGMMMPHINMELTIPWVANPPQGQPVCAHGMVMARKAAMGRR